MYVLVPDDCPIILITLYGSILCMQRVFESDLYCISVDIGLCWFVGGEDMCCQGITLLLLTKICA